MDEDPKSSADSNLMTWKAASAFSQSAIEAIML